MIRSRLLPVVLALSLGTPALATTVDEVETRCPVGGRTFKHMAIMSYTTFGELPDGMPVGTGPFPMPLTECPDNGLVIYREFDDADAKRLTPLVLGTEYQAMRKGDTPAFRAAWLAERMGDRDAVPWMLLTATWEAKAEPADGARLVRYQQAFLAAATAVPADARDMTSIMLRLRAANALRELGRFEEAERLRAGLLVIKEAAPDAKDTTDERAGVRTYLARLAPVIARRDPSRAPIDMGSAEQAASRCLGDDAEFGRHGAPLDAFETAYCARPAIEALTDSFKRRRADAATLESPD